MPPGRLDVTVLGAKDLKNTQTFGRQDPFFVVRVGQKHFTSEVAQDAGKHPVWNARFSFDISNEDRIYFTIRNRNVLTSDALLGEAQINLAKVFAEGKDDAVAQVITGSGKVHGTLSVILLFSSYGGKAGGQPKANKQQVQQTGSYPSQPVAGFQQPVPQYQQPPPPMQGYPQQPTPSAPPMPHSPVHQPPQGYPPVQPYPQQPRAQPGAYPPQQGYPPQSGSPPPGYPPQHGGHSPPPYPPPQGYAPQPGYQQRPYVHQQGGMPPAGYPPQQGFRPGYGAPGYYTGAAVAPAGMYYASHKAGKHKHGKKGKKGKKKWF